jgi:hypothetical protein
MALYFPGWADFVPVLTTWAIGIVLLLIGAAVHSGRVAPEFRVAGGWGALCAVLTLWGVFVPLSLRVPAIAVAVGALAAQLSPRRRVAPDDWRTLGRLLLVTLPLWAVMAPVRPSQIDTFLNLLPNADYLVDYARLPTAMSPPIRSWFPAAPYDTQFLAFLGSLVDRGFPASGMSLVNVLLRLVAGLAIARVLAGPEDGAAERSPSWATLALGMLIVTLFDPGFVPRFHFSAYGENPLAVTAVLAGILFVERRKNPVELSLILAAMINTKQSGIGLVLALAGAAVAVGLFERRERLLPLLKGTALVLLPAALLYAAWRYHVAHAGVAELEPLPVGQWNWAMIPAILRGIAGAVNGKPVYFVCVAVAFLSFPLLLRRGGWSPAGRFTGFFAATFLFYNAFLLVTYIAHFSPEMSAEAHSYFRYNTHLSLLLVLALSLTARELFPARWAGSRFCRAAPAVAVVLALLAPVAFAERLRFDIEMPQPLVWDLARELKPYLKDGDRLAVLAPGDDGEVGQLLDAYLANAPPRRRHLDLLQRDRADTATLDKAAAAGYKLAVITCTPSGVAALLRYDAGGWHQEAVWPHSQGIPLSHWQRSHHWPALCR